MLTVTNWGLRAVDGFQFCVLTAVLLGASIGVRILWVPIVVVGILGLVRSLRTRLVVAGGRLEVRNIWRDYQLEWADIEGLQIGHMLMLGHASFAPRTVAFSVSGHLVRVRALLGTNDPSKIQFLEAAAAANGKPCQIRNMLS